MYINNRTRFNHYRMYGVIILFLALFLVLNKYDYLASLSFRQDGVLTTENFESLADSGQMRSDNSSIILKGGEETRAFGAEVDVKQGDGFCYTCSVNNLSDKTSYIAFELITEGAGHSGNKCVYSILPGMNYINGTINYEAQRTGEGLLVVYSKSSVGLEIKDITVSRLHGELGVLKRLVYAVQACFYTVIIISLLLLAGSLADDPAKLFNRLRPYLIITFVTALLFFLIHGGTSWDFVNIPICFNGGDDAGNLEIAKNAMQGNSYWVAPMLAAPDGLKGYDFPMIWSFYYLFCKLCGLITANCILVYNFYYFCTFLFAVYTFTFAARKLGCSYPIAAACAFAFSFSQYHMNRSMNHASSSSYFTIPIVFWLCYMLQYDSRSDRKIVAIQKSKTYLAAIIVACSLIGSTDIFYAYFGCAILFLNVVLLACKKRYTACVRGMMIITLICVAGVLNLLPSILNTYLNGPNPLAAKRSPYEAYYYGLLLVQLVMPRNVLAFHPLNWVAEKYIFYGFSDSEAAVSYIGLIAIAGLICLFLALLSEAFCESLEQRLTVRKSLVRYISVLNIFALLLGFSSGLGPLISLAGFTKVRTYNRISVYILMFALLFAALIISKVLEKYRTGQLYMVLVAALLAVIHLVDAQPFRLVPRFESIQRNKARFEDYYQRVAAVNDKGAMILQLPALPYAENKPESGGYNNNSHLYGYIFTEGLRWSYGPFAGTEADFWQAVLFRNTSFSEIFHNAIKEGYSGVSVNTTMYKDGAEIIDRIKTETGMTPEFSDGWNGIFYYSLKNKNSGRSISNPETANLVSGNVIGQGWWPLETDGRWAGKDNTSVIYYPSVSEGPYTIHIEAQSVVDVDVEAYLNDQYIGSYHIDPGIDIIDLGTISDCNSVEKTDINTLKLVHNNSFVPAQIYENSKDKRYLTVNYQEISINSCHDKQIETK